MKYWVVLCAFVVLISIVIMIAGAAANIVVSSANDGKMPVVARPEYRQEVERLIYGSERHCLANEKTKHVWLSDRYYQIVDGRVVRIYSIGDVLLWSGSWVCNATIPILVLLTLISWWKKEHKNEGGE